MFADLYLNFGINTSDYKRREIVQIRLRTSTSAQSSLPAEAQGLPDGRHAVDDVEDDDQRDPEEGADHQHQELVARQVLARLQGRSIVRRKSTHRKPLWILLAFANGCSVAFSYGLSLFQAFPKGLSRSQWTFTGSFSSGVSSESSGGFSLLRAPACKYVCPEHPLRRLSSHVLWAVSAAGRDAAERALEERERGRREIDGPFSRGWRNDR